MAEAPDRLWVADITCIPTQAFSISRSCSMRIAVAWSSPFGRPKKGPPLTAAVRDGRTIVRVGTEEWLRRGLNQRMARNGTQNAITSDSMPPSSHLSTKPGQVQSFTPKEPETVSP